MGRLRILCLAPYFLPSRQGGGSLTAIVSLVEHLRHDVDFVVATSNRDLLAAVPYPAEERALARARAGIEIHHLPSGLAAMKPLWQLLGQRWDLIYLNSVLSPTFCALLLLLRRLRPAHEVLLAPRGELMAGALANRRAAKLAYLQLLRGLGLLNGVRFHATSALEAQELHQFRLTPVLIARDLPPKAPLLPELQAADSGPLRVVFLSRIEAKKNLLFALQALQAVDVPVQLDIIGPINDHAYWAQCQAAMARLPGNVVCNYLGSVDPEDAVPTLSRYELFLFPTQAENNGYVIQEAMLAGCALLISDRTPWRGLAQLGIGDDLPLDSAAFARALTLFALMSQTERLAWRQRARQHGLQCQQAQADVQATLQMFKQASRQPP